MENPETADQNLPEATIGKSLIGPTLFRQAAATLMTFFVFGILSPWSLQIQRTSLSELWRAIIYAALIALVITLMLAALRLRTIGTLVQRLTLDQRHLRPADVERVTNLPLILTLNFLVAGWLASALMALPPLRPDGMTTVEAASMALLSATLVGAGATVNHEAIRALAIRAIELAPTVTVTAWLAQRRARQQPQRLVIIRGVLAVAVPVLLVGMGSLLVTSAHLRSLVDRTQLSTAKTLIKLTYTEGSDRPTAGTEDALVAARTHGFFLETRDAIPPGMQAATLSDRLPSGQLRVALPIKNGYGVARFATERRSDGRGLAVAVLVLALLLASLLGGAFGSLLATDLSAATDRVGTLAVDTVLRGGSEVSAARFAAVVKLDAAVDVLSQRFRVFAEAQERTLEAKDAAQRMRQLLFAAVSHDLKSPLNAVLGFSDLLRSEPLTPQQVESLDVISSRGRELLALIETILDAARVEAGQLDLSCGAVDAAFFAERSLHVAYQLYHGAESIEVEVPPDMPAFWVDGIHASRAMGVILSHALKVGEANAPPRMRLVLPGTEAERAPRLAAIEVLYSAKTQSLRRLQQQLAGRIRDDQDRGMTLQLGLARAVIELHRGHLVVEDDGRHGAVVTIWLPTTG